MFTIQWIGDDRATLFAAALTALRNQARVETFATGEVERIVAGDVDGSSSKSDGELTLIVVAEKFPGEHPLRLYELLRRRWPSVPIVRLCGSWCEGELRTHVPPLVPRYAGQQAADEWDRDFATLRAGECPSWGRPATTTIEERVLERCSCDAGEVERSPLRIGVAAEAVAVRTWLCDALRVRFADVAVIDERSAAERAEFDVLVWAAPDSAANRADRAAAWRRQRPTTPIVALCNFPRERDLEALASFGIQALPATTTLLDALERTVRQAAAVGSAEIGKSD
jgi:hypothetical protein